MQDATPTSMRAVRASTAALAVLMLASTAACRDDVTSPKVSSASVASAPQAVVLPTTTLTVRIVNIHGQTINENLSIKVFPNGSSTDAITVSDATGADKDLAIGQFRFAVPMTTSYRVCAFGSAPSYAADPVDACKTVTGPATSIDVGSVLAHRKPIVSMLFWNTQRAVIGGATIGWTTSLGTQQKNSDPNGTGTIVSLLPGPSTAVYCEIKAPTGYQFINPVCAAIDVAWDTAYTRILIHERLPKKFPVPSF